MTTPKYNHSVLSECMHELSLNGADDECGDVSECGFFASLFRGIQVYGPMRDITPEWEARLSTEDLFALEWCAGVIVIEDDQGFVDAVTYETQKELSEAWDRLNAPPVEYE